MKKLSILLPVIVLTVQFFASCDKKKYAQKDNYCTASPTGDTVVFEYNKPMAVFESCKNPLQPVLTKIMDSRCPTDVVCVWAGKVGVVLNIDTEFSIMLEPGIQKDTLYNKSNYRFTLVDVIPYPISQPPTSVNDQKAIISITKL